MRQEDEQEARRAKLAAQNQLLAQSSGRYSNDLGQEEKRLGDYEPAQTRSGSSILTG